MLREMDNNTLMRVGLIVLVGLATRNAFLIVEFAMQAQKERGGDPVAAAVEASQLRLRPILMMAFIIVGFGTDDRNRPRRRDAPSARYGGVFRDVGCHFPWSLFHAGLLRAVARPFPHAHGGVAPVVHKRGGDKGKPLF